MRVAVANTDFLVILVDKNSITKPYQVANGEDLKILSGSITGAVKSGGTTSLGVGYLVEIEGQPVFVDESLLEVSK